MSLKRFLESRSDPEALANVLNSAMEKYSERAANSDDRADASNELRRRIADAIQAHGGYLLDANQRLTLARMHYWSKKLAGDWRPDIHEHLLAMHQSFIQLLGQNAADEQEPINEI